MLEPAQGQAMNDPQGSRYPDAMREAYKLLANRARFVAEVRSHLEKQGYDTEAVEYVVQSLSERKLINDENTTQSLIERNSGKRSVGIERLRAKLERLGAPEEAIEQSLNAIAPSETERALDALRSKYKMGTARVTAGRFLVGRGFESEAVEAALDAFCETFPEMKV